MALVKRVLNPAKKSHVVGDTFHLLFLGGNDAVLYDMLWDEPIIYGNKTLVKDAVVNDKKLTKLLERNITKITVFVYRKQDDGQMKLMGQAIKGAPKDLTIPNY